MQHFALIFFINFIAIIIFMFGVWLISLLKKDVSIVDGFWGLGFVMITWITFGLSNGYAGRKLLVALLISVWGVRLAAHIFRRDWGKPEDRRYRAWRAGYGERYWIVSLFTVFGLQAVLLWIISLSSQFAQLAPHPDRLTWLDGLGACVWLFGFLFEAIGDWQLLRFKKNAQHAGEIMDRGLWAYTRHPNYFGEAVVWWGMFLIASATPNSWWSVLSPLLITGLLLKVSGVTLLDRTMLETRPQYGAYMERTSAFFPRRPKKKA